MQGNSEPTSLLELGLGSNGSHPRIRSRGDLGVDPLDLFSDWKVSNLTHPDPECNLDYVPNSAREVRVRTALSTSFGFGGQNGALVMRRVYT